MKVSSVSDVRQLLWGESGVWTWSALAERQVLPGSRVLSKMALVAVVAVALSLSVEPYNLRILTTAMIFAIAAIGMNIAMGWSGLPTLALGGLMGIGAYVSAIMMSDLGASFAVAAPCAILAATLVSASTGLIGGRVRSHYFIIVTLGVQLSITALIIAWSPVTGGSIGLVVTKGDLLGLDLSDGKQLALLTCALLTLGLGLGEWLRRQPLGRNLVALGQAPIAAESAGVRIAVHYVLAMGLAGAFGGVAGVLLGQLVGYLGPDTFTSNLSVLLLASIVLGGLGSHLGSILGVAFIMTLVRLMSDTGNAGQFVYGLAIIAGVLVFPGGIASIWTRVNRRHQAGVSLAAQGVERKSERATVDTEESTEESNA